MHKYLKYLLSIFIIISLTIISLPTPVIYQNGYINYYDKNNNLIVSRKNNKMGEYLSFDEIDKNIINSFIVNEDKEFYKHNGFNYKRIIKVFFENIFKSNKQGASTITQQYARTILLNNKKTLSRKLKEAYYTFKLERKYSKNQILEGYLNNIYLGYDNYGIDSASRFYFNKSARDITLNEAALLSTLASMPTSANPLNNYNLALKRKDNTLKSLYNNNYISYNDYILNINKDIKINSLYKKTNINYYLDEVNRIIKNNNIDTSVGINVYTNLDLSIYNKIDSLLKKYNFGNNQISIVILENSSNRVIYNIGGYDYNISSYNRSNNSLRSIGSTIKPFLYSFALENGFSLNTKFISEKTNFTLSENTIYSPKNANDIYPNKKITMKEAYAVSDNIYAIKTLLILGTNNFRNYLKKFNIYVDENVISMALGTSEITLLNLVTSFSIFSNKGIYKNYSFIDKITNAYNKTLYSADKSKHQVISNTLSKNMNTLMKEALVNNNYYKPSTLSGYNFKANIGKSGSTNKDSYILLANDLYTLGIWLGKDNNSDLDDYTTSKYLARDILNII